MLQKYQRQLWYAFLAFMAIVALWFSFHAVYHLYNYYSLDKETRIDFSQWHVKEISDERYLLEAVYQFKVDGKLYEGHTLLDSPIYRNPETAERVIPQFNETSWNVWYSGSYPQHSALQKNLPVKECISSLLLWGILIYFILLRSYYSGVFNAKS